MKKLLFTLATLSILSCCTSQFKTILLEPLEKELSLKLPLKVNTKINSKNKKLKEFINELLIDEINSNIISSTNLSKGFLDIDIEVYSSYDGFYNFLLGFTLGTGPILGIPAMKQVVIIYSKYKITDSNNKVIWKKIYNNQKNVYYGYWWKNNGTNQALKLFRTQLNNLKNDIEKEIIFVQKQLENSNEIPKTFKDKKKNNKWKGNGSGVIISKSGYIVTNYHVIDKADEIEVEFILDDKECKFNAEIIKSDKENDLAVIKITDENFNGVKELPYNFKKETSDVGTKVYAYGYPLALTIMGKEIKVTDGIISSKTGFNGNVTNYGITAPVQGGNSGGPLFDDKCNLIGINSSKLNNEVASNVGYSIKSRYILSLIDILPEPINLPSNKKLANLPLTEQIKEISKYVVLVKVK